MLTPLYIHTAFENGSPMDWEVTDDGTLVINPPFDYERGPMMNRQLTHWHFRLCGTKGQSIRIKIPPKENIYGGRRVNAFAARIGNLMSADNGAAWSPFFFEMKEDKSLEATVTLAGDEVLIARIEPYTTRHLADLLARVSQSRLARIENIGHTVEGRTLEMITLTSGKATRNVLIRARAHPWEAGGNWFVDGLVDRALADPAVLDATDICILPMAAKDGVVHGHTRFNVNGYDLNRGFVPNPAFSEHNAPENLALTTWLDARKRAGALPFLAMDLHDDDWGNLHITKGADDRYNQSMVILDELMRKHTYYSEGMCQGVGSTFGDGLYAMYGIHSVVYELNSNWLAKADAVPGSAIWKTFGAQFADVLIDYAEAVAKP